MDIVYVYKKGPENGTELRYSLRSLKNIKHDKVYIVGDIEEWMQNVIHIQYKDELIHKFKNVREKYRIICKNKDISDDFILMHDDHYILKPVDTIEYFSRGKLRQHAIHTRNSVGNTCFFRSIRGCFYLYPEGDSFEVHCPIIYNKNKLSNIMNLYGDMMIAKRSAYCNYYGIKGIPMIGNEDCKIWGDNKLYVDPEQQFMSSNNDLLTRDDFIPFMESLFAEKCKYEK